MKKIPFLSKITLIAALVAMAVFAVGFALENMVVIILGFAVAFVGIITPSIITSFKKVKARFPLDDPPQNKARSAQYLKLSSAVALAAGIVMFFINLCIENGGTRVFSYIGLALLIVGVVMLLAGSSMYKTASRDLPPQAASNPVPQSANIPYSPDPVISRILADPYVLQNERIRQLREVQRLLQYPEIQQIFFEPAKLYELFANERVGELLNIVRDWITQNNADDIFGG